MRVTCGIDWASDHHDVALVDEEGKLQAKARIGDDTTGFAQLISLLAEHGDTPDDPIPVAIETSRGLLVANLRATGRPVYTINPMAAARYRERSAVTRKKSDHLDAMALAGILRTDRTPGGQFSADVDTTPLARPRTTWRRPRPNPSASILTLRSSRVCPVSAC